MACGTVNGKPLTTNEHEDHQQRELEQQEGIQQQAKALALKLAQTYEELTRLLERNPAMKRQITEGEAKEDKVYQKLKQRLKMADMAPRCRWVRQDGTSCRSPQMKQHIYCFAHRQMAEARTLMLMLPAPEDANAIQVGLMRIQKALIEDTISAKKAGLLLYSMQLALTNVGQTTFGKAKDEEMVRETVDEEEAFSENRKPLTTKDTKDTEKNQGLPLMNTDDTDFGEGNRKPLTTKDTKDTAEEMGLPRMDADERGLQGEESREEVEFVPVPGGYGFERIRLRMDPELGGQRRPPQDMYREENREIGAAPDREIGTQPGAAVPHEHAEPYANLG
jgi:hypothetical protein